MGILRQNYIPRNTRYPIPVLVQFTMAVVLLIELRGRRRSHYTRKFEKHASASWDMGNTPRAQ